MLHGQCVALGYLLRRLYFLEERVFSPTEEFFEIRDMNVGFDLPIFLDGSGLQNEVVLETTKSDKKMEHGQIKFILLKEHRPCLCGLYGDRRRDPCCSPLFP